MSSLLPLPDFTQVLNPLTMNKWFAYQYMCSHLIPVNKQCVRHTLSYDTKTYLMGIFSRVWACRRVTGLVIGWESPVWVQKELFYKELRC